MEPTEAQQKEITRLEGIFGKDMHIGVGLSGRVVVKGPVREQEESCSPDGSS